jgi:hypothetical protein
LANCNAYTAVFAALIPVSLAALDDFDEDALSSRLRIETAGLDHVSDAQAR